MRKKLTLVLMFLVICTTGGGALFAQKQPKSWKEWSKKDAEKVLTDSPWSQLQVDMDLTEPTKLQRPRNPDLNTSTRLNEERVSYGIRFFSARPVRQAFIRLIQLKQKDLDTDTLTRMNTFAEKASEDSIVIAVTVEGPDTKPIDKVMQVVRAATTSMIKSSTYLERTDGKRIYLEQFTPPGRDGFGARFVFPRRLDERLFITSEVATVRFVSDMGNSIKFDMLFKVSDMMFDGKLEY
jgi:hypothetical protein